MGRWTESQLAALRERKFVLTSSPRSQKRKFFNVPTAVGDITFDSAKEARRYEELLLLERSGKISELRRQVPFVLLPKVRLADGTVLRERRFFADFTYIIGDKLFVEDVKSIATRKVRAYTLKRHLMKTVHGIDVIEV